MATITGRLDLRTLRWAVGMVAALVTLALLGTTVFGASPAVTTASTSSSAATYMQAAPVATPGQDFEDVFPSNAFYGYLHNLYLAGVVGGYTCVPGGPNDPCVPPANLPYYHPSVSVTRLQMTKFIDLGRRNIAD